MARATVDIIIPCYNTGKYLRQAIDSCLAQTYPAINVLVVDDGSTDNTKEIVDSYGGVVGYFHQENRGLPSARNAGIEHTHHEYVCILDADDVILPSKVADQAAFLNARPEVGLVHSKVLTFSGDDIRHPVAENWRPHIAWENYLDPLSVFCALCPSSVMIRRAVFERFRFPEDMTLGCEDWWFWAKCALEGVIIDYLPKVHTLYRFHPGSMSGNPRSIATRETELMRRLVAMFTDKGIEEAERTHVLALGSASVAAQWLSLGERQRYRDLIEISDTLRRSSVKRPLTDIRASDDEGASPSLTYLMLSKDLLDLGKPEIALVMLLKCGDIRSLREEATRSGCSETFEHVWHYFERATPSDIAEEACVACRVESGGRRPGKHEDFFMHLEREIPHRVSIYAYLKHQLGLLHESAGDFDSAIRELAEAIDLNPNYAPAHFDSARVLAIKGLWAQADAYYGRCCELDAQFADSYLKRAKLLTRMGRYGRSVGEFLKASRIDLDKTVDYVLKWVDNLLTRALDGRWSAVKHLRIVRGVARAPRFLLGRLLGLMNACRSALRS